MIGLGNERLIAGQKVMLVCGSIREELQEEKVVRERSGMC